MPKNFLQISIVTFFIFFVIFISYAPLSQGVPCIGNIVIDTNRNIIQHQYGGRIEEVSVREGQSVQTGQMLMRLNDLNIKARLEEVKQHYYGLRANEGRLNAELEGKTNISFHPDLVSVKGDLFASQHMLNQERLFSIRLQTLNSEISTLKETLGEIDAKRQGFIKSLVAKKSQETFLDEQIENMSQLVKSGFASLSQLQEMQIRLGQIQSDNADIEGQINSLEKTIMATKQKMVTLQKNYKKESEQSLAQVILDVNSDAEKLKALNAELQNTVIKAASSGQVIGLQYQTAGAVIPAGQRIMDIVPKNHELIIEAKVEPRLIDKVSAGQSVEVRFSNFADMPQLKVEGKVDSISGDAISTSNVSSPDVQSSARSELFYLARIKIQDSSKEKLQGRELQPGMPVQVLIITGERSLLNYLIHPLIKRISASMKES
jgi:protease secretion system membrane fusion protein